MLTNASYLKKKFQYLENIKPLGALSLSLSTSPPSLPPSRSCALSLSFLSLIRVNQQENWKFAEMFYALKAYCHYLLQSDLHKHLNRSNTVCACITAYLISIFLLFLKKENLSKEHRYLNAFPTLPFNGDGQRDVRESNWVGVPGKLFKGC